MVGVVEEGATVRALNERFVFENDDHIQLCENSSCSWLGKRARRQQAREEMPQRRGALCMCECVYLCVCVSQDFRSHLIALHANETSQTSTPGQGSAQLSTGRKATLWRHRVYSVWKYTAVECVHVCVEVNMAFFVYLTPVDMQSGIPGCVFVGVWECCCLFPSLETVLCQLHSAKCHSVFPLPWKHLPLQCLPAEEYTHTHTQKAGRLKSTYSLLGNRVWVAIWPPPLLSCYVLRNKSHTVCTNT